MTGCYGTCAEDRARERELNAYLDKTFGGDNQRYRDALNDLADDAVTDAGDIEDIFDNDPNGFFLAVAAMVKTARSRGNLVENEAEAFRRFEEFLTDGAKQLPRLQSMAEWIGGEE